MSTPLVSVLLACHNLESFVEQALDSIAAQDFTDFELIITDDASTDASLKVIQAWLQRTGFAAELIAHEKNVGTCATRNELLLRARGEFICFVDADDWSEPHRLRLHTDAFSSRGENVAMITGEVREVSSTGEPLRTTSIRHVPAGPDGVIGNAFYELLDSNFIPFAGTMLRRRCLTEVGGFDENLFLDDLDLWRRLSHRFQIVRVTGVVANYRIHSTGVSHNPRLFKKIWISDISSLKKWVGYSPETDKIIARRMRISALNIRTQGDRRYVDGVLRFAETFSPSALWFAVRKFSDVPTAGAALGYARALKRAGIMKVTTLRLFAESLGLNSAVKLTRGGLGDKN